MRPRGRIAVLALAALFSLAARPSIAAQTMSSTSLLLRPNVHVGESFRWEGRINERAVDSSIHGVVERLSSRTDAFVCTVVKGSRNAFLVSRRVYAYAPAHQPWVEYNNGSVSRTPVVELDKPSIIIRGGREFETDGPALNFDPICKFYSVTMFGVPPARLKTGTMWHFSQTTFFGGTVGAEGTTTVTKFDAASATVAMRVKITDDNGRKIVALVDMIVRDGGEIVSGTDRGSYAYVSAIPKEIGTPNWVTVWTLHRS